MIRSIKLLSFLFLILSNFVLCHCMDESLRSIFVPIACNSSFITNVLIKLDIIANLVSDKDLQFKNMHIYFGNPVLIDFIISNNYQHLILNKDDYFLILALDDESLKEIFACAKLDFDKYKETRSSEELIKLPSISDQQSKLIYLGKYLEKLGQILDSKDYSRMACIVNISSINYVDDDGVSPVFYAASRNNIDNLSILIKFGANIKLPDKEGCTPLHWASYYASPDTCLALLKIPGINVLIQDQRNKFPLDYAKEEYYKLKDKADKTEDDFIKMRNYQSIGKMLIKHLALYTKLGLISKNGIMFLFNDVENQNHNQSQIQKFKNFGYNLIKLFTLPFNNQESDYETVTTTVSVAKSLNDQQESENTDKSITLPQEIAEYISCFLVRVES